MPVRPGCQVGMRPVLHVPLLLRQLPGALACRESARVKARMRMLTTAFCYWLGSSVTQRLHWRIHREACFGRSIEGQNAMEAAHKKHHEQ